MSKRRLEAVLCTALIAGGFLAACDEHEPGRPTSQPDPVTTTSSSTPSSPPGGETPLPFAGAPKVANPLDATKFSTDPCLALKSNQAAQLKVDDGKSRKGNLGMVCDWSGLDSGALIDLQFLEDSREGLSSIYRANTNGGYDIFEPVADIEGFPAVVLGDDDDKSIGMCTVDVGLSDELVIQISLTQSEEKRGTVDPCAATKAVAQLMLQNMKAGA